MPLTVVVIFLFLCSLFTHSSAGAAQWIATGPEGGTVNAMVVDPVTPTTLYAGTLSGVFRSTTGGGTWSAVNSGLSDLSVFSLAIDPVIPTRLYAGTASTIFRSDNGGETWSAPANSGLPPDYVNALTIAKATATTPTTLYAGTFRGVFMSTDGGASWIDTSNGLANKYVVALVVDPASPTTLYAGTFGGVFKKNNGGAWTAINNGLPPMPDDYVNALAVDSSDPKETALFTGTGNNGVFVSTDGGGSWNATTKFYTTIRSLTLDSTTNPPTLYVGTQGGGVYFSINGGSSWSQIPDVGMTNRSVVSLAVAPCTPSVLLAGTDGGGVNMYAEKFMLTVDSENPASSVSVTVSQKDLSGYDNGITHFTRSYLAGSAVILTAPATADGNSFSSWSGCDSSSGNQCSVSLSADRTVTATYTVPSYMLSVTMAQSGGTGSVNTVPPTASGVTIACSYPPQSGICATTQPVGTAVTLKATPGSSSIFSGWTGHCVGSGLCAVSLDGPRQVTATFTTLQPVRNPGPPIDYTDTLQAAYNKVVSSATIQSRAVTLTETLTLGNPVAVVLHGGFDAGYVNQTGYTTLQGKLIVGKGSLVADRLTIK